MVRRSVSVHVGGRGGHGVEQCVAPALVDLDEQRVVAARRIASGREGSAGREDACGDLGERGEVEILVGDAGFLLEPRHHRVVQVPLGGEVAVHGALADAGAFGDGAERERVPAPASRTRAPTPTRR